MTAGHAARAPERTGKLSMRPFGACASTVHTCIRGAPKPCNHGSQGWCGQTRLGPAMAPGWAACGAEQKDTWPGSDLFCYTLHPQQVVRSGSGPQELSKPELTDASSSAASHS